MGKVLSRKGHAQKVAKLDFLTTCSANINTENINISMI